MKALVVSLKFHPGHVSHLVASYRQCEELGYETCYYVAEEFAGYLPAGSNIKVYGKDKPAHTDLAIFLFPCQHNLAKMVKFKLQGAKVIYTFHEPIESFKEYREAGYTSAQLVLERIKHWVSALTVRLADTVILPSQRAVECYKSNSTYRNSNCHLLPLMYDDEASSVGSDVIPRRHFSYIGTVASDHSFNEYVAFIKWAFKNKRLPDISFLIATKSPVAIDAEMQDMIDANRLTVVQGKPLSNGDINFHYASSLVVWNAYVRTTQSGVLPKAFMFGTPALVLRNHLTEYAQDGVEVAGLTDNTDKEEICSAVSRIVADFESYSKNCRSRFLSTYYYRRHNDEMRKIIEQ